MPADAQGVAEAAFGTGLEGAGASERGMMNNLVDGEHLIIVEVQFLGLAFLGIVLP